MLDFKLAALNDNSKCVYTIGSSYGYYNLEKKSMQTTGISMISQGNTKKELYYQLCAILDVRRAEKFDKIDFKENCQHLDTFNTHSFKDNEKRDMSHIREYEGKFYCLTCGKNDFTKKEYDNSHKPRTRQQLNKIEASIK